MAEVSFPLPGNVLYKESQSLEFDKISYATIKDIEIYLPKYEQQVELSDWFDEVQENHLNLQNELGAQIEKLTEYVIFSNCINDIEK